MVTTGNVGKSFLVCAKAVTAVQHGRFPPDEQQRLGNGLCLFCVAIFLGLCAHLCSNLVLKFIIVASCILFFFVPFSRNVNSCGFPRGTSSFAII